MTKLNDKQIAAYEAKGFNRWTKGNMDRLYINARDYGCKFDYYNTGNIRNCYFNGERVSNAEGYRFKSTKVYIDVKTGELSITTSTDYEDEIRAAVEAIITEVENELAEPEKKEENDMSKNTYQVVIDDERENVDQVMVDETYTTLDEAKKRFDELKESYDFYEHEELWLYVSDDGGVTQMSIDGYTVADRN